MDQILNIIISAGGRFHAHRLAQQLLKRTSLSKLFTFDYNTNDTMLLPPHNVHVVQSCKLMNTIFMRLHLERFINRAQFNVFKDNVFDTQVAQRLKKMTKNGSRVPKGPQDDKNRIDLFVVWANYARKSIPVARAAGAKIILECGSCHIKTQQQLIEAEFERWGVPFKPIDQRTIDQTCAEYEATDYIMTPSTFARQSFIDQGVPVEKVLMVPCGVDLVNINKFGIYPKSFETRFEESLLRTSDNYNHAHPEEAQGAVSKGLVKTHHNKPFKVLFVGMIALHKGVQYLIQAWHSANLPKETCELIIVGNEQKDFLSIKSKLPITSNIIFTGSMSKEKLNALYQTASLFVLPSIQDGFGMVMGEAMGHGVPVICSTNTGGPDIITDGIDGWIVPPTNSVALAEKIIQCYNDPDKSIQMGLSAQKKIQEFSWDCYGSQIWEIYKNII